MYFFTFLSQPKAGNDSYGQYGGTYVNCWLNSEKHDEAEEITRQCIDGFGWTVEAGPHFLYGECGSEWRGAASAQPILQSVDSIGEIRCFGVQTRNVNGWLFLQVADTLSPGAATRRCASGLCRCSRHGDNVL